MKKFDIELLKDQFKNPEWIMGITDESVLTDKYEKIVAENKNTYHGILKTKIFQMILADSAIAIDKNDIFQDKLLCFDLIKKHNEKTTLDFWKTHLPDEFKEKTDAYNTGAFGGGHDFGHTSPNSKLLLKIGFSGLLERAEKGLAKDGISDKQKDFYESCVILLSSIPVFLKRLADAVAPYDEDSAKCLMNIADNRPSNTYEAMQTLITYFFLHEFVFGTRVRTLGRLDVLLTPFYKKDLEDGTFTKEEIKEMLKFFLYKFWAANIDYDLPFCLSGIDMDGNEVTNELTYLIVETYNELDIHSPKIHIRVSDKTPIEFIKLVMKCIRDGNSSFVFANDKVTVKALMDVGIEERDARNYVPIGCYEPAVWGVEIGCTGNASVICTKAAEYAMNDEVSTFEEYKASVKKHLVHLTDRIVHIIVSIEKYYGQFYSDPFLSCMYDVCMENGIDAYEGSAKYNNSSLNFQSIASLTDIVCAVKKLVFDEKKLSFKQLSEILSNNWEWNEELRQYALSISEKYGNGNSFADSIAKEFSDFAGDYLNNTPNGRGGVFKAGLFSINENFYFGSKAGATADGRLKGEPLSKNLCATVGMDRNGITALINSVTAMDHSKFSNGSVLDIILHPSAVTGEDGLIAMCGILLTYFKKGGFGMHGNVFDATELQKAQKNPEKYKNLQVRVCGWNAFFVNLSKAEQDAFIKQAENR